MDECQCETCIESRKLQELLDKYVPKEHHKFFWDFYMKYKCIETDAIMADTKVKKLIKHLGAEKAREILWS